MQQSNSRRTNSFQQTQSSTTHYQIRHGQNVQEVAFPFQSGPQRQESNLYLHPTLQNGGQNHYQPNLLPSQIVASHQIQPTQAIQQRTQEHQNQNQTFHSGGSYFDEQQNVFLQDNSPRRPIPQNVPITGRQNTFGNVQYSQHTNGPQHILQAQPSFYSDSVQYSQNAPLLNKPPYSQHANHLMLHEFSHRANIQNQNQSTHRRFSPPSHPSETHGPAQGRQNRRNHSHHSEEIQHSINNQNHYFGVSNAGHPYSRNGLISNNRSVSDIPSSFTTGSENPSFYFSPFSVSSSQHLPNQDGGVGLQSPSSSTSPEVSMQSGQLQHEQQEPVAPPQNGGKTIRSFINRFLGPQKAVRESSGYYDSTDVDHVSLSASSHHSSTDFNAKKHHFNNGLRRFNRKTAQAERSDGRYTHASNTNEFASFPAPNPSSIHQSFSRSTSSLRVPRTMNQTDTLHSTTGPIDASIPALSSGPGPQNQSTTFVQRNSVTSQPFNYTNNQTRTLSNISASTHSQEPQRVHHIPMNSNPIGFPKQFSDRPPTQTGTNIIKVVPTTRKPSQFVHTQNHQRLSSSTNGVNEGSNHYSNSVIATARTKPPRQPTLRPTAQPIRKQISSSSHLQRSISSASQVLPSVPTQEGEVDEPLHQQFDMSIPSNQRSTFSGNGSRETLTTKKEVPVPVLNVNNVDDTNSLFNSPYQYSQTTATQKESEYSSGMPGNIRNVKNANPEHLSDGGSGKSISNAPPFFQSLHKRVEKINSAVDKQNMRTEDEKNMTRNDGNGPTPLEGPPDNLNLDQTRIPNGSIYQHSYNRRPEGQVPSIRSLKNDTIQSRRSVSIQNQSTTGVRTIRRSNETSGSTISRTSQPPLDISYKPTTRSDVPSLQNDRKLSSSKTSSATRKNNKSASIRPSGSVIRDSMPIVQGRATSTSRIPLTSKQAPAIPQIQSSVARQQSQRISSHQKTLPISSVGSENEVESDPKALNQQSIREKSPKIIPATSTISSNHQSSSSKNRTLRTQTTVRRNPYDNNSNERHAPEHSRITNDPARNSTATTTSKMKLKSTLNQGSRTGVKRIHPPKLRPQFAGSASSPSPLSDQDHQSGDFQSIQSIGIPEFSSNRSSKPNGTIFGTRSTDRKNPLQEIDNSTPQMTSPAPRRAIPFNQPPVSSTILLSEKAKKEHENKPRKSLIFSRHESLFSSGSSATISPINRANHPELDPLANTENDSLSGEDEEEIQFEESMTNGIERESSRSVLEKNNSSNMNTTVTKNLVVNITENDPQKSWEAPHLCNSPSPSTVKDSYSSDKLDVGFGLQGKFEVDDERHIETEDNDIMSNRVQHGTSETPDVKRRIGKNNKSDQSFRDENAKNDEELKKSAKSGPEFSSGVQIRRLAGPISRTIPTIQNDLHPDVKAACSSMEGNARRKTQKTFQPTLSAAADTADSTATHNCSQNTTIGPSSQRTLQLSKDGTKQEGSIFHISAKTMEEFQNAMKSMKMSFNDEFATDLNESKLSTSIRYSTTDHTELKKIRSVEWVVQNSNSKYEVLSLASFSRTRNLANLSSMSLPLENFGNGAETSDFSPIWSSLPYNSPQLQRRSTISSTPITSDDPLSSGEINNNLPINDFISIMKRLKNCERMREQLARKRMT